MNVKNIIYITFNPLHEGKCGGSVNDNKVYKTLQDINRKTIAIYPPNKGLVENLKIQLKIFKKIISGNTIFIIRGALMGLLVSVLKPLFNNNLFFYTGCSSIGFLENMIWSENIEYRAKTPLKMKLNNIFERIFLLKLIFKQADVIFAENNKMKSILSYFRVDLKKIILLPYYVEAYFSDNYQKLNFNLKKDIFKIGYTGRFQEYDKLEVIFNALKELKEDGYNITFTLAGDGPNRTIYEDYVKTIGIDDITYFLGLKKHKEVSLLIDDFHCLLLPMVEKLMPSTIPIKMLEAVVKGKIIITNNTGNISSLFFGFDELIIDELNSLNIKKKLKNVIHNYDYYSEIFKNIRQKQIDQRKRSNFKKIIKNMIEKCK